MQCQKKKNLLPQCPRNLRGSAFRNEIECIYLKANMTIIKRITKEGFSIQSTLESNSLKKKITMLNLDWLGYNGEGVAVTKPNTLSWKFNLFSWYNLIERIASVSPRTSFESCSCVKALVSSFYSECLSFSLLRK